MSRNKDDITEAVHALDVFTKNYCLNCKETKKQGEFIFMCDDCIFRENITCKIKEFASKTTHDYPLKEFGSMRGSELKAQEKIFDSYKEAKKCLSESEKKIIELDLEELSKLVKCHEKHITGCDNKCKKCELNPEPMLELICHLAKVVLVLLGEFELK